MIVRIGGQRWTIERVDEVDGKAEGECLRMSNTIRVQKTTHDHERDTLLHELIHAALAVTGVTHDLDDKEEERLVRAIAPVLNDILDWKIAKHALVKK